MKEDLDGKKLDLEWVLLILEAKQIGLSIHEVQDFLLSNQREQGMIKKA
jgi:DNA-binding transcriptional MerR regulator